MAEQLADAVTQHATPVGSGTVARTQRIPIEKRAESAVIAWLRHQTTAYEDMKIPRVKGKRREVRRMLAERSRRLLERYRAGGAADPACPLQQALSNGGSSPTLSRTNTMQIWVDADACPGEIKELLFRAAKRTKIKVTLVANQAMRTPRSEFVDSLLVPAGMNVADRRIVELVEPGDLVITADIPLAG